ncbi:hypothetical protein BDV96DRAFT_651261 [Lophiotrema nucula]|uniref:Uncharacterized protein n=1 Tax=Lophiotrema nucula TaxID=690887 RepID=A0A6A5YSY6_9PLEO|nr:hypothetical protein BDV96DRAFT_651261 [Lophiotrema nucula]
MLAAKAQEKSEFELLSAGFPDPSPDIEDVPVDPDLIPRAGALKDQRLNRITNYEQARIDAYNTDLSREMGVQAPPSTNPLSPPVSENGRPRAFEKLISVGSSNNGDKGSNGTVDLKKGWPKPPARPYGPRSTTTRTSSSRNDKHIENTFDYAFRKYDTGEQDQNRSMRTLSPTTVPPNTFGPSTSPTRAHVSPFTHMRGALPVDAGFEPSSDNGVMSDLEDGIASVRLSESQQAVFSAAFDAATAHNASVSEMIGCKEENVQDRLLDQAEMLSEYKLSKLQETKIDADAVRYALACELMGWEEFIKVDRPASLKDLIMMPKNEFYRLFSNAFVAQENAQQFKDFQTAEAQRFSAARAGKGRTNRRSDSPVPVASEGTWTSDEESNVEEDSDDEDDGGVVFGGRSRLSTPSIG